MLPATFVTLATFLLELSNSSPVYNMQPAFVTTHIGSFTGRNIRNLPCISRKNPSQSGVCMFAIDCLKSNGTHLGTCIDRFYFGSCCYIEPQILENTIDADIVLDKRQPPVRLHNTTTSLLNITTTNKPLSSGTTYVISSSTGKPPVSTKKTPVNTKKPPVSTKKPTFTTIKLSSSSTTLVSSTKNPQIMSSITKKPSRITTKPPIRTTTNKLADEAKLNTTSSKPSFGDRIPTTISTESSTIPEKLQTFQIIDGTFVETTTAKINHSTSNEKTVPTQPPTKAPTLASSSKPTKTTLKPSSKPLTSPKPITKPVKTSKPTISTKVTSKPTKPAKVTSTTSRTTTSTKSSISRPTKKPAKPASTATTENNTTSLQPKPTVTTTVGTTKRPPISVNTTTTKKPTSTYSTPTTTQVPQNITNSSETFTLAVATEAPVMKLNVSQALEDAVGNVDTNEIINNAVSSTTMKTPGLVTWTFENNKTTILGGNAGVVLTNITEEWIPLSPQDITPQDDWVLLPIATHQTPAKNETFSTTSQTSSSSPGSPTQIPDITVIISEQSPVISTSTPSVVNTTEAAETPVLFTDYPPIQSVSQNDTSFIWFTTTISEAPLVTSSTNISQTSPNSTPASTEKNNATTTTSSSILGSIANLTTGTRVTESSTVSTEGLLSSEVTSMTPEPEIKPVNMSDFTDVCGRRMFPGARIVGGEKSAYGRWPWQISLRQWRTSTYLHKCGAALLNENWAITAAHCVDNVPPNDLLLRLGEYDLSTDSEPYLHQERRVQIVASHPQFDPSTFEYDLALLRFYEPVTFQPNILPVCVPRRDENFVGKTAYVTGWGRLYEDGPLPSILQEVSVPVINNSVCETMYRSAGYIEHIPNIFICAGWRRGGFDSCEGDSGGPMVIQRDDKRFQLAGIISWGIGCAEPNQPGVYTRISEFRDWINQILQF